MRTGSTLFTLFVLAIVVTGLQAQFVWTGGSAVNGSVADANNWAPHTPAVPVGDGSEDVTFGDITPGHQTNVLIPTSGLHDIIFSGSARPAYTFSGAAPGQNLTITGDLFMNAGNGVIFNTGLGITLADNFILETATHTANVSPSTILEVKGNITGSNQSLAKAGSGTLILSGVNSYTGDTTVNFGTLQVDSGSVSIGPRSVYVGNDDGNNGTLAIKNGGDVSNSNGIIGVGSGSTGTVTVDGTGSTWTNTSELYAGYSGTGSLAITNGGTVSNTNGVLAFGPGSSGTVTVDGTGSTWTNSGVLFVGHGGTGSLVIANGGTVNVNGGAGSVTLGLNSGGAGTLNIGAAAANPAAAGGILNAASITTGSGTGTLQFNTTGTSSSPYYLTKNGTSGGAAVVVSGSTQVINTDGYNVFTGANTYTGGTTIHGGTLEVKAGSISHTNASISVGQSDGDDGSLKLSNSGDVSSFTGIVGNAAGSTGTVTVDGAGSTWTNSNYLYVGAAGTGFLTISTGGAVTSPNTSIGNNPGGEGSIYLSDSGSTLTNSDTLYVGAAGRGSLAIDHGATVTNITGSVGNNSTGFGQVSVTGPGSLWTNTGALLVGNAADGQMSVWSGGQVSSANGYVGELPGTSGYVEILETGSNWTLSGDLYLGNGGEGTLVLFEQGRVNVGAGAGTLHLGHSAGGVGVLLIGTEGDGGMTAGGIVNAAVITTESGTGILEFQTNATSASPYYLTRNGASGGTAVTITGPTHVVNTGGFNVISGSNTYDGGTSINGGTLVLDGGSITQTVGNTTLGENGGDNGTLVIKNSGDFSNAFGLIGGAPTSTGTVTVDGIGSTWTNANELYVGLSGTGTLTITSSGTVTDTGNGFIAYDAGSSGTVTVNGSASSWNNSSGLYVGHGGIGSLSIVNGGLVTSGASELGSISSSSGSVTIDGTGSTWLAGSLVVGSTGAGSLTIARNGTASANGGAGAITLGLNSGGAGILNIGAAAANAAAAGGIVNAATITTASGIGTLQFKTTATFATPYYLTTSGNSGGTPVQVTGATQVVNTAGFNVLNGANSYTGGTTISGGTLVGANNSAFGTGSVTLDGGRLRIASGVAFTNALSFTGNGGTVGGNGTFLNHLTIGGNTTLSLGDSPGILSFSSGLSIFGGQYNWQLQSVAGGPNASAGTNWDLLAVTGVLDLSDLAPNGHTLKIISLNALGNPGAVSDFSATTDYSWTIVSTTSGFSGSAANILIDRSGFANTTAGTFSLGITGNDLRLNFSPIPEPSTYALLAVGLGVIALGLRRRRA